MSNVGKPSGNASVAAHGLRAEMAAFDNLPRPLRDKLNGLAVKFSAVDTYCRQVITGADETAGAIEAVVRDALGNVPSPLREPRHRVREARSRWRGRR